MQQSLPAVAAAESRKHSYIVVPADKHQLRHQQQAFVGELAVRFSKLATRTGVC